MFPPKARSYCCCCCCRKAAATLVFTLLITLGSSTVPQGQDQFRGLSPWEEQIRDLISEQTIHRPTFNNPFSDDSVDENIGQPHEGHFVTAEQQHRPQSLDFNGRPQYLVLRDRPAGPEESFGYAPPQQQRPPQGHLQGPPPRGTPPQGPPRPEFEPRRPEPSYQQGEQVIGNPPQVIREIPSPSLGQRPPFPDPRPELAAQFQGPPSIGPNRHFFPHQGLGDQNEHRPEPRPPTVYIQEGRRQLPIESSRPSPSLPNHRPRESYPEPQARPDPRPQFSDRPQNFLAPPQSPPEQSYRPPPQQAYGASPPQQAYSPPTPQEYIPPPPPPRAPPPSSPNSYHLEPEARPQPPPRPQPAPTRYVAEPQEPRPQVRQQPRPPPTRTESRPQPRPQPPPRSQKPANSYEDEEVESFFGGGGSGAIPGSAGTDYPTLTTVPHSDFSCAGKAAGYYADIENRCQAYFLCSQQGHKQSFLCPNGTVFNQASFVCEWWYNVDCKNSEKHFSKNDDLYKVPAPKKEESEESDPPQRSPEPSNQRNQTPRPQTAYEQPRSQVRDARPPPPYQPSPQVRDARLPPQPYQPAPQVRDARPQTYQAPRQSYQPSQPVRNSYQDQRQPYDSSDENDGSDYSQEDEGQDQPQQANVYVPASALNRGRQRTG